MIAKLRKFFVLSALEKCLFVEAYIRLGIMRAAVLTVSFKRLTRSLRKLDDDIFPTVDDDQLDVAQAIGKAVHKAANNTPWESTCLTQVLAAQRMLQKRGIGGVISLGAKIDSNGEENLSAHAWLESNGVVYVGEEGCEQFRVLGRFGWGSHH